MAGRYWREAATLILVGRAPQAKNKVGLAKNFKVNKLASDYRILCLKRSSKSAFMPETYVFPGGTLDEADLNPQWLSVFKQQGYSEEDLIKRLRFPGNRLEIYTNKTSKEMIPELSFRICALRETFEETGLLLISSADSSVTSPSSLFPLKGKELKEWRLLVHNDASEFINLIQHVHGLPSILSLHEWMSWLTPTSFKGVKNRFDTAFYITFIDSEIPLYPHNEHEAEELKVGDPIHLMKSFYNKEIILRQPQIHELSRLLNFTEFEELKQFSEKRSVKGISRCLPYVINAKDGILFVFPGDDLYPQNPDVYGLEEETGSISESLDESRANSSHLYRFELRNSGQLEWIVKNTIQEYSHVNPICSSEIQNLVRGA